MFDFFKKKFKIEEAVLKHMMSGMNGAGFVASHISWRLSDGEPFEVVVGEMLQDGRIKMNNVVGFEWLSECLNRGREILRDGDSSACRSLLWDANRKSPDSDEPIKVIAVEFGQPLTGVEIGIPYTPQTADSIFSLSRLKISCPQHLEEMEHTLVNWFFDGIEAHEHGAKVWEKFYYSQFR